MTNKLRRFQIKFYGKKNGALGLSFLVEKIVEAENEKLARMKAYDTHEHISGGLEGIYVREIQTPNDQS
jgi:hypothetical protein